VESQPAALEVAIRAKRRRYVYKCDCESIESGSSTGFSRGYRYSPSNLTGSAPNPVRGALLRMIAVMAIALSAATLFGWQDLLKRFATTDPWEMRREYFFSSIAMVRTHPFVGSGLGAWPIIYPRFATGDMGAASPHAHNDWIEWASDGGIPYFLLLLVPIVHACRRALRQPWGLGVLALSLHALVDFPFQVYPLLLLFFLLVGALDAADQSTPVRVIGATSTRYVDLYPIGAAGFRP
jgi:hypothetical protein